MYAWLQRIWYGGRPAPWYLRASSAVFGALVRLRLVLYRRGWLESVRIAKPVIVVGNLTVGGTGKTPLVIWLAEQLAARGLRAGIVLRGYGANPEGTRWVEAHSEVRDVGDEALLIRLRTGCPVVVDVRRARAAAVLAPRVDVVIADDGLQHLNLARDFEFAVIDGVRGCGNGRMLPAGPLREPVERLQRVDRIVVNGGALTGLPGLPAELRHLPALRMQVQGTEVWPLGVAAFAGAAPESAPPQQPLSVFAGRRVHAVAGIGDPQRFFALLRAAGIEPIEHAFPDHHPYRERDIVFGDTLPLLMTEKDAVKCSRFQGPDRWYLPVQAVVATPDATALLDRLQTLVAGAVGRIMET